MRINHIALWTNDPEGLRLFYEKYFGARTGTKYFNHDKQFTSYFLSFDDDCKLEIMHQPDLMNNNKLIENKTLGITHFAISVGSKENVDKLTAQLRADGYPVIGNPRKTGDGFYESVVADPDQNMIEITI
jgi:lactoylglutathione lyase